MGFKDLFKKKRNKIKKDEKQVYDISYNFSFMNKYIISNKINFKKIKKNNNKFLEELSIAIESNEYFKDDDFVQKLINKFKGKKEIQIVGARKEDLPFILSSVHSVEVKNIFSQMWQGGEIVMVPVEGGVVPMQRSLFLCDKGAARDRGGEKAIKKQFDKMEKYIEGNPAMLPLILDKKIRKFNEGVATVEFIDKIYNENKRIGSMKKRKYYLFRVLIGKRYDYTFIFESFNKAYRKCLLTMFDTKKKMKDGHKYKKVRVTNP
mgnify:CR=1 FL=1|jgi:hypothetical protein